MTADEEQERGVSFPCALGIKAMGRQVDDIEHKVKALVAQHVEDDAIIGIRCRASRNGNFHSVTCEVWLENREQMEAIYQSLFDHPDILMTL